MIDDDVLNDENSSGVRGVDHHLQIRERAPVRVHGIKITAGIAVVFAAAIFHDGRNPDGGEAKRLDVIQLLFDAPEVATVNARAAAGVVGTGGVVVRAVAVEKAVGKNLVDALRLPRGVGSGLGRGEILRQQQEQQGGKFFQRHARV